MKRRSLLLAAATVGCRGAERPPLGFAQAALGVARLASPLTASGERWCLDELGRLVEFAREAKERKPGASWMAVLRSLLFEELGFVREVEDTDLSFVLLPSVLRSRRGSCVGLGTAYLALAEALGLFARGVMMPGHFYVRVEERGRTENVELLRRGEAMPQSWYDGRFPIPGGRAREYARSLTFRETLGVIEYNLGNDRRRQLRLADARDAYARAVRYFSDFAEAHASLGAVLHLLGELDQAAASYRTARDVNPHLPRVDSNIALLESEQRPASSLVSK
jgi:regulator of sirC expression with transglutaminase-like and TPR domain